MRNKIAGIIAICIIGILVNQNLNLRNEVLQSKVKYQELHNDYASLIEEYNELATEIPLVPQK